MLQNLRTISFGRGSVQTLVSFYLLNKMPWCAGIKLLVKFSKYLESFSTIRHKIYMT